MEVARFSGSGAEAKSSRSSARSTASIWKPTWKGHLSEILHGRGSGYSACAQHGAPFSAERRTSAAERVHRNPIHGNQRFFCVVFQQCRDVKVSGRKNPLAYAMLVIKFLQMHKRITYQA